jgi:hypothetical protein
MLPLRALTVALALPLSSAFAQQEWIIGAKPLLDVVGVDASGTMVFQNPGGGTRLANGSLLVADLGSTSIRLIDATGKLVRSVGREGSGPGEFRILFGGNGCGSDSLFVYARETAVMFTPTGTEGRRFPVPADSTRLRPLKTFTCMADGSIAYLTQPLDRPVVDPQGMMRMRGAAVVADRNGKVVRTISDIPAGEWMQVQRGAFPRPLSPMTYLTTVGDRVVIGVSDSARVWMIAPSGARTTLALPFAARAPTADEFKNAVTSVVEMAPVTLRPTIEPQLSKAPVPETLPPFFGLFGDPTGALWVQQSVPGSPRTAFIVLDATGKIIARPTILLPLSIYEIGRDYILGSYTDANDEVHLAVLSLRRQ